MATALLMLNRAMHLSEDRACCARRYKASGYLCVKLARVVTGCGEGLVAGVRHVVSVGSGDVAQQTLREEYALTLGVA